MIREMSQKQTKLGSPGTRARSDGGRKSEQRHKDRADSDPKYNENIVRNLYECFQDIFDYDLVASVCHTCQWDANKATEALMVLGDAARVNRRSNSKGNKRDGEINKPKSLPSTLKPNKSDKDAGSNSLYAMPSNLRSNPAHMSTSSLSSGQVWQRHYKSKPQSPGLLTMIPPHSKEGNKLKKSGSAKSLPAQSHPTKVKESPEVKRTSATIKRIQHLVQNGVKVLVLMRGLPGAGKSHLAQVVVSLVTKGSELCQHIFSTDDYFILLGRGNYAFDSHQLPLAHNWNQRRVFEALRRATNPVIVDNTHTQAWEMEPYVSMAVSQGYLIEVLEPVTPWRTKESELAKKNVHAVPREKIRQMLERYEKGWTGEKLIELFGLNYVPCGSSHVSQELTMYNNSPLAQHRQHAVIETPEKPKRKKNSPKRKDRKILAGIEITEDKEKQLEELNQLFAEYGKEMDPVSKIKVLESGVPISEVVSRMRKLQGNVLPLPKSNICRSSVTEVGGQSVGHADIVGSAYIALPRESPSESVEPDTMSSSNASETSECESDTELMSQIKDFYKCGGECVNEEDVQEDYDKLASHTIVEGKDAWTRYQNLASHAKDKDIKNSSRALMGITSSQEELSLIDYEYSTNPVSSSQEEFSLLDFDDPDENKSVKDGSSSSSEEQETQLQTLQESLRDVLMNSYEKRKHAEERSENGLSEVPDDKDLTEKIETFPDGNKTSDHLLKAVNERLEYMTLSESAEKEVVGSFPQSVENTLIDYFTKDRGDEVVESNAKGFAAERIAPAKKSPDLEEIPLPSIPPYPDGSGESKIALWPLNKCETFEDVINSWSDSVDKGTKNEIKPKPERSKNQLLGTVMKSGIQRDKSPEELLRSVELSWSSVPFTSSWEDLNKKPTESKEQHFQSKPQRKIGNKADSSTNTEQSDFNLWKEDNSDLVKLIPQNRNINQNLNGDPIASNFLTEYPMMDKGSMTSDFEDCNSSSLENSLDMLSGMFPDISSENLKDVLEKCNGDIQWAVELLLDSPHNQMFEISGDRKPSGASSANSEIGSGTNNVSVGNLIISDGKKTIKRRRDRKAVPSKLSLMLKKQIESSIHINDDCYQGKTLILKKSRYGENQFDDPIDGPFYERPYHVPEFHPSLPPAHDGQQPLGGAMEEEEEEEDTIPMKIDPEFFQQLAKLFGHSVDKDQNEGPGSVSVINIPISLGHQIYSCWLEAINRQVEEMQMAYDNMIKEDELLAKALQEQEHDHHKPDLREIMDMELAMALYKQEEEQYRRNAQETLASKLTKQLLFEAYPKVERNMILDLFRRQGNSFQKTVELLNNINDEPPKTVIAPEFLAAYESKLIEQVKQEAAKEASETPRKPIIVVKQTNRKKANADCASDAKDVLVVNPAEFRQKMTTLHKRRNDCCKQAQEAFRKKNYSAASYYSHIASLYKERIVEMNQKSISLKIFGENRSEIPTKLDLHFLFVTEAIQVLDMFLDRHICNLNHKNVDSLQLFLITGRGLRNRLKKAKLKPAIKKRLDQRKLNYVEHNPGMLKVIIHKGDYLSDRL